MKLRVFLLLIVIAGIAKQSFAQSDTVKKQLGLIVKTDILMPFINGGSASLYSYDGKTLKAFSFTVEKLLKKRHSIQLTFVSFGNYNSIRSYNINPYGINQYTATETDRITQHAIAITPEYKFFVSKKKNHTGYYLGVSASYMYFINRVAWTETIPAGVTYYNTTGPATINGIHNESNQSIAYGIINGVQYYLYKHLALDLIAEGGLTRQIGLPGFNPSFFAWRLGLNIGYKF